VPAGAHRAWHSVCSVIDRIADSSPTTSFVSNRVFLGSDTIHVKMRRDMHLYTCRAQTMICEPYGAMWECRCGSFDLTTLY
jgi:hypothetical protein